MTLDEALLELRNYADKGPSVSRAACARVVESYEVLDREVRDLRHRVQELSSGGPI